jgi:hypothetical protein
MKIKVDTGSLLLQTSLSLLHILHHAIFCHEPPGFVLIVSSRCPDEGLFEIKLVDHKSRLGTVILIKPEGHKRIHNAFDLGLFNGFPVTLFLDEIEHRFHHALLDFLEKVFLPFYQMQCIDVINILLAFVDFSFNPVSVKISE